MLRLLLPACLLLCAAGNAQAQVIVRAPGVYVEVGSAVVVRAPFVNIVVPRRISVPRPVMPVVPVVPSEVGPPPVPSQELPPTGAVRAITPSEFVSGYKPFRAGQYEVVFVHPCTNLPVKVCFDLPVEPRRVVVNKTRIDFRWGLCKKVSVCFNRDGSVNVKN